jgi:hypothetical protein
LTDEDSEEEDMAYLAVKMENDNAAAVVVALFEGEVLTDVQLFGSNVGDWYIKPRSLTSGWQLHG